MISSWIYEVYSGVELEHNWVKIKQPWQDLSTFSKYLRNWSRFWYSATVTSNCCSLAQEFKHSSTFCVAIVIMVPKGCETEESQSWACVTLSRMYFLSLKFTWEQNLLVKGILFPVTAPPEWRVAHKLFRPAVSMFLKQYSLFKIW